MTISLFMEGDLPFSLINPFADIQASDTSVVQGNENKTKLETKALARFE